MGKFLYLAALLLSLETTARAGATNFRKQGEAVTRFAVIDLDLCDGPAIDGCEIPTVYLRPSSSTALEFPSEVEICSEDAEFIDLVPIAAEETASKQVLVKKYLLKIVNADKLVSSLKGSSRRLDELPPVWFHCQVRDPESNDIVLKTINVAIGKERDEWREGNARVRFHLSSGAPSRADLATLTSIALTKKGSTPHASKGTAKSGPKDVRAVPLDLTPAEREALRSLPGLKLGGSAK
mgnify:CR=1 FL=1